eukprot:TRINITY_DN18110_c0_g1_i1.p1 TRINITY_DN18110_c0_g1~~TRINITY_DN18110_c0_g1_i1.p1  ORF type:complete len:661 (+),score=160.60 TRINITY_DN18110_c0_g1_i1:95-2077(+)
MPGRRNRGSGRPPPDDPAQALPTQTTQRQKPDQSTLVGRMALGVRDDAFRGMMRALNTGLQLPQDIVDRTIGADYPSSFEAWLVGLLPQHASSNAELKAALSSVVDDADQLRIQALLTAFLAVHLCYRKGFRKRSNCAKAWHEDPKTDRKQVLEAVWDFCGGRGAAVGRDTYDKLVAAVSGWLDARVAAAKKLVEEDTEGKVMKVRFYDSHIRGWDNREDSRMHTFSLCQEPPGVLWRVQGSKKAMLVTAVRSAALRTTERQKKPRTEAQLAEDMDREMAMLEGRIEPGSDSEDIEAPRGGFQIEVWGHSISNHDGKAVCFIEEEQMREEVERLIKLMEAVPGLDRRAWDKLDPNKGYWYDEPSGPAEFHKIMSELLADTRRASVLAYAVEGPDTEPEKTYRRIARTVMEEFRVPNDMPLADLARCIAPKLGRDITPEELKHVLRHYGPGSPAAAELALVYDDQLGRKAARQKLVDTGEVSGKAPKTLNPVKEVYLPSRRGDQLRFTVIGRQVAVDYATRGHGSQVCGVSMTKRRDSIIVHRVGASESVIPLPWQTGLLAERLLALNHILQQCKVDCWLPGRLSRGIIINSDAKSTVTVDEDWEDFPKTEQERAIERYLEEQASGKGAGAAGAEEAAGAAGRAKPGKKAAAKTGKKRKRS